MTTPLRGTDLRGGANGARTTGRIGAPEDVASGIQWLLEAGNDGVSGQVIGVDVGLVSLRGEVRA